MLDVLPDCLIFNGSQSKFNIKNNTEHLIAFKVKSTNSKNYTLTPALGILDAFQNISVTIYQKVKLDKKDKF